MTDFYPDTPLTPGGTARPRSGAPQDTAPSCAQVSPSAAGAFARKAALRLWAYISQMPLRRTLLRRHIGELRGLLRALWECEVADYQDAMRGALAADPQWQAEVHADLGGARAMQAWERRCQAALIKAQQEKEEEEDAQNPPANEATTLPALPRAVSGQKEVNPAQKRGPKTDRHHLFRLQIIRSARRVYTKPQSPCGKLGIKRAPRPRRVPDFLPPLTPLCPADLGFKILAEAGEVMSRAALDIWRAAIAAEQHIWLPALRARLRAPIPLWQAAKAPLGRVKQRRRGNSRKFYYFYQCLSRF